MKKYLLIVPLLICVFLLATQTANCQNLTVKNSTSCTLEMQLTIWQTTTGQQINGLLIPPGGSATYPLFAVFPTAAPGAFWAGFKAMNPCSAPTPGVPGVDILGIEPTQPNDAMSVTPCVFMGNTQTCNKVQATWNDLGGGDVLISLF
ncbi:MAG: hypothetical protein EOP52_03040 [Sphingobacteriales bacterium]|nr:MAG: hypothetical protein EOP52_03040 [Sphingobacteriales bacterium]